MKNDEFHIPFLHGMVVVAVVTIVSMIFAHHFIHQAYFPASKTSTFTSNNSEIASESPQ